MFIIKKYILDILNLSRNIIKKYKFYNQFILKKNEKQKHIYIVLNY